MTKFKDTQSLGRSVIAPFRGDESWNQRHARRKNTNLSYADELKSWCHSFGWNFEIKNEGHHWIFKKNETLIEWWPSSAKLVKNKQWKKGIHCHDFLKVIEFLEKQ